MSEKIKVNGTVSQNDIPEDAEELEVDILRNTTNGSGIPK